MLACAQRLQQADLRSMQYRNAGPAIQGIVCVCAGSGLRMQVQAAANMAAQSLEAHKAAVQAELAHAQTQLLSAAHSGKQQTGDGERWPHLADALPKPMWCCKDAEACVLAASACLCDLEDLLNPSCQL